MTTTHTIDVEAERKLFEAATPGFTHLTWPTSGEYRSRVVEDHWQGWLAAKRSIQPTIAAEDVRDAIPRESNDALIALARYWKLDGDWMTCKGCKRSLIASRDGEALNHADGCKLADQQHPWAQLRDLIARRPIATPTPPSKG